MEEINLYKLLKFYVRYWLVLFVFTFIGLLSGYLFNTYIQTPNYKSNVTLFVVDSDKNPISKDSTLINNYMELIKSRRVLEPVINNLKLNKDYDQIVGALTVSNQKDTAIIKMAVVSDNPETSKNIANLTIESFKKQINELYGKENIQVVDGASLASSPYNVRKNLQLAIAATAGLLSSIIVIFFMYDYRLSNGTLDKIRKNKPKKEVVEQVLISGAVRGRSGRFEINPSRVERIGKLFGRNKRKRKAKKAKKNRKAKKQ